MVRRSKNGTAGALHVAVGSRFCSAAAEVPALDLFAVFLESLAVAHNAFGSAGRRTVRLDPSQTAAGVAAGGLFFRLQVAFLSFAYLDSQVRSSLLVKADIVILIAGHALRLTLFFGFLATA